MSPNQTSETQPSTNPTDTNAVRIKPFPAYHIPAEIVDLVVQELKALLKSGGRCPEIIKETLANLLSVSRAFQYSVRRRIFRKVELGYDHPRRREDIALLHQILKGDPSVQRHIKKLTINFYGNNYMPTDRSPDAPADPDRERINCPDFISLLHLLSKAPITHVLVKKTSFDYPYRRYLYVDRFGPSGMEAFMALRCNPHIVSFAFEELDRVPSMLITGIPSTDTLCTLELHDTDSLGSGSKVATFPFTKDSVDAPPFVQKILGQPQQFPFQNLRLLVLDRPSRFPLELCRSLEDSDADPVDEVSGDDDASTDESWPEKLPSPDFVFRSLEILVVGNPRGKLGFYWHVPENDHRALTELVKRAPKLRSLDFVAPFSVDFDIRSPEQYRFLQHIPKHFSFRMVEVAGNDSGEKIIADAIRVIEDKVPVDKVEHLCLSLFWKCRDEAQLSTRLKPSEGWEGFVSALNKVHSLRSFALYVDFRMLNDPSRDLVLQKEVEDVVKENLKGLKKEIRVMISVECLPASVRYVLPKVR